MDFSRTDRLQSQIIKEMAQIISEDLKDKPSAMITFTRAEVSRDLKHAKIYFSVLGDLDANENIMKYLNKRIGIIRKNLGRRMRIRYTPELKFVFDDSVENVLKINQILKQINEEKDNGSDTTDN